MPSPALLIPWLSVAAVSSNCADLQDPSDRLVCADATLAQQEAQLRRLYAEALHTLPAGQGTAQAQQQEQWQHARAACPGDPEPHGCLAAEATRRIVALQIGLQRVPVFAAVTYRCPPAPLYAAYYRTEPPAVRLNYGTHEVVAFIAPSASGARYRAPGVEIWEHHGVARFSWHGASLSCPRE